MHFVTLWHECAKIRVMPKLVDHDQRRREIAAALTRLIVRVGVEGASVRAVAAEAGWSMGAVRYYFGTQEELLRFAVTLQDLRTVMLLRRQLSQERTRTRPWFRLARQGGSPATWRRSWHSLLRFPAARVVRLAVLTAVAAACQVAAFRGTTAAVVGTGLALFVLGLELAEPLSQEIDQPDRAESLPVQRGVVHLRLLGAPALSAAAFAVVGAAVVFALEPGTTTLAVIAVLALPVTLAGAAGAIVNIVSGAPDPYVETAERNLMPPEVAGTATMVKAAWPLALSIAGSLPVLAVRAAYEDGQQPVAAALRTAIGAVLLVAAILTWVRFRDDARRWWRSHLEEARHAGAAGARR